MELLKAGKFDELSSSVPNKVNSILQCEPITSLISHVGEHTVEKYVASEIVKLAGNVNVNPALNIKTHQVPVIAEQLIENYKWESIEDFTLCFRRAAAGLYGEIYRLDGAVIGQWFSRYLDEKYDALEQKKNKEKHEEKQTRSADVVDGAKYIKQMLDEWGTDVKPEPTNAKENEFQRVKLERKPPDEKYIQDFNARMKEFQRRAMRDKYPDATDEQIEELLTRLTH